MNISMLVKGLALGSLAVASTAFAAPKMGGDMYGIAGLDIGHGTQFKLGLGKKVTKDVSAEVFGTAHFSNSCTTIGVAPRGIYHVPVDFAGIKPYAGAYFSYTGTKCSGLIGEALKLAGADGGITSNTDFGYSAGVEYPINNKIKAYADLNGSFRAIGNPALSAGAKVSF